MSEQEKTQEQNGDKKLSRRDFLKLLGLAGGSVASVAAAPLFREKSGSENEHYDPIGKRVEVGANSALAKNYRESERMILMQTGKLFECINAS